MNSEFSYLFAKLKKKTGFIYKIKNEQEINP